MTRAFNDSAKFGRLLVALVFLVGVAPPLLSQTVQEAAGLAIPMESSLTSTRDAALASALAPTTGEGAGFLGNPAGLGDLVLGEFSIAHRVWMADTNITGILTAFPHDRELGGLGLAIHRTSFGMFEGRDATGAQAPDPSAGRWSCTAAWGKDWGGGFCVGVALRASDQDLGGLVYRALLADVGLVARLDRDWKAGLSLSGLGLALDRGSPPTALRLGTSYVFDLEGDLHLLLAAAGTVEHGAISRMLAGTEVFFLDRISLRAGYRLVLPDDRSGGGSGPTVGAGYSWKEFRLDYAFLPLGEVGTGHQVSLAYLFPGGEGSTPQGPDPRDSVPPIPSVTPTPSPTATSARPTPAGSGTPMARPSWTVTPTPTPLPSPSFNISVEVEEDVVEGTPVPETTPGRSGK